MLIKFSERDGGQLNFFFFLHQMHISVVVELQVDIFIFYHKNMISLSSLILYFHFPCISIHLARSSWT